MNKTERRGAPRIAQEIPLTLGDVGRELATQTTNLSASGTYCALNRFIPAMTKLQVRLEVPDHPKSTSIICQGVVVRVQPAHVVSKQARYHVAIFFSDLADHDRATIARYVQQHLRTRSSQHGS